MLKKIKKIIQKEIKNRYEKLEDRYLDLENNLYSRLEDRLTTIEDKFNELSDLLKEEIKTRKERNEMRQEKQEDNNPFEEEESELEEEVVESAANTGDEVFEDDLTSLKGLGHKMAEKLAENQITSFAQLATMTAEEIEALDEKIKSFAARYERYEWRKQADERC